MKPLLNLWTYWDFVYENGTNPIADWHRSLSDDSKILLQTILKTNKKTENPIDWIGFRKFLKGKASDWKIWEIGFKADKREYRLIGVFGPNRKQATFLVGCYHKQKVYEPNDCIDTSIKRNKLLNDGRGYRNERKIRLDV